MSTICISSHSNFANVPLWACACVTQSRVCAYMCAGFAVYVWRQWEPLHSVLIILAFPEQKAKERDVERKTKSLEQYLMVVIWIGLFSAMHRQATIGRCIEIMGFSLYITERSLPLGTRYLQADIHGHFFWAKSPWSKVKVTYGYTVMA